MGAYARPAFRIPMQSSAWTYGKTIRAAARETITGPAGVARLPALGVVSWDVSGFPQDLARVRRVGRKHGPARVIRRGNRLTSHCCRKSSSESLLERRLQCGRREVASKCRFGTRSIPFFR